MVFFTAMDPRMREDDKTETRHYMSFGLDNDR